MLGALAGLAALALLATGIGWVRADDRGDELAARVAELERQADPQGSEGDSADPADEPSSGGDTGTGDRSADAGDESQGSGSGEESQGSGSGEESPEGAGEEPSSGGLEDLLGGLLEDGQLPGNLNDMLDGLLDGAGEGLGGLLGDMGKGLAGVNPSCLAGEGGLGGLGGLGKGTELTGSLEDQVGQIADLVEKSRELAFDEGVDPVFLPADEFDQRVADMVRDEYPAEQADLDSRTLQALGAIPRGTDLLDLQADLLAGQVAGFYDPETGEIVVRDDGDGELDSTEHVTLAHELDHALTDQALGLPDTAIDGDSDANLARLALVEGDATLLMQRYSLAHLGLMDQLGSALDPSALAAQKELDKVAPFLREQLMFPYLTGLAYTCRLTEDGGWNGVDAAYDDLPETTAEILFDDWDDGERQDVTEPSEPEDGWEVARRDTLGAAQLLWLLQAPGGDEDNAVADARDVVRRWAGDSMVLATKGEETALGLTLADGQPGGGLCDAVDEWYDASFDDDQRAEDGDEVVFDGGEQTAVLRCDGAHVSLGIGPDVATARSITG